MLDESNNLALSFIQPSQSQKHVSFNETVAILDSLVHLTIDAQATQPPVSALPGARFIVSANPASEWGGHEGHIAVREEDGWSFLEPREGFLAWFRHENGLRIFSNSEWRTLPTPDDLCTGRLGISASADQINRFCVSSPASLFNHAGTSHQIKINKASNPDTASMLFQSNWSGRAELGLMGSDQFSLKVSEDGSQWVTALSINDKGLVTQPTRPVARAFSAAGSMVTTSNSPRGFAALANTQGGMALGSSLPGGGNTLVLSEAGTYLICLNITLLTSSGHSVSLVRNGAETIFTVHCSSSSAATLSRTTIASFNANDTLNLIHQGSATVQEGPIATELVAIRL